jgi:predicted Zn-dependent protease
VMAASHAVEWLDLKGTAFCADCRDRLNPVLQSASATCPL